MFLGWYDPDKKKPAAQKVAEATERYVEKFGGAPEVCLASVQDATELEGKLPVPVRGVAFVPRHTFYVGVDDPVEMPTAA